MTVRRLRYRADKPGQMTPNKESPGLQPFGAFAVSKRMQKLTIRIGMDVAALAGTFVPSSSEPKDGPAYADSFHVVPGKIITIEGLPRVTSDVVNTADHAAALEFGSGDQSVGDSAGEPRPQGGSNKAMRPLGRAGAKIGDFHGG